MKIFAPACKPFGGIFDYPGKSRRLEQIQIELENPDIWKNPTRAQELGKVRSSLSQTVQHLDQLEQDLKENEDFLNLIKSENAEDLLPNVTNEINQLKKKIEALEFQQMFSHPMDPNNAFLDINSGSGGTEAQDWAEMLLRMYLRWCDAHGFKTTISGIFCQVKWPALKV